MAIKKQFLLIMLPPLTTEGQAGTALQYLWVKAYLVFFDQVRHVRQFGAFHLNGFHIVLSILVSRHCDVFDNSGKFKMYK